MYNLTPTEKITRVKMQALNKYPFFGYIMLNFKFIEKPEEFFQGNPTMAVDNFGNCYYYAPFVEKLSEEHLTGVICHEVMHPALMHLDRFQENIIDTKDIPPEIKQKLNIWNYATDTPINDILIESDIQLPDGCIKPINHQLHIGDKVIKDINKKTAEMIYNELYEMVDKIPMYTFDVHMYSNGGNEKGNKEKDGCGSGVKDWKQILTDAAYFAKSKGNLKGNLERLVDKIINKKLSWRQMLYRFITNEIQDDFTYMRPSRKFASTGIYFPTTSKENIKILAAIDTSGSIRQKELALFLGEIYKIVCVHRNIELEVVFHDTEISSKTKFNHSSMNKVKSLKPTGGGGTSHQEVFEYANKTKPNVLICFTDGMSDIDVCKKFQNTLFILTSDDYKPSFGSRVVFDREALK